MYTKRQLQIIYNLMINNVILSSKKLAEIVKVTDKTVKNDIAAINDISRKDGFIITSYKAKGYQIDVVDDLLYAKLYKLLSVKNIYLDFNRSDTTDRTDNIIKILLTQQKYITLEEIAEKLGLSRSTVKLDVKAVKNYLEYFKLDLKSKPGYGMKIIGKEFDIRRCMLQMYRIYTPNDGDFDEIDDFTEYFHIDAQEKKDIRKRFLTIIRNSEYNGKDHYINILFTYLIFLRKRSLEKDLEWTSEERVYLKRMKEYELSGKVFNNLTSYIKNPSENEILGFTLLLAMSVDISDEIDICQWYPDFVKNAEAVSDLVCEYIETELNLKTGENLRNQLINIFIPSSIQARFDCMNYFDDVIQIKDNQIKMSPVAFMYAKKIAHKIKKYNGWIISESEINLLAVIVFDLIEQLDFSYKKRNLIISSRNGYQGSESIKKQIVKRFGNKYFEAIEVYPFYEVRKLNMDNYDYILLNYSSYSYKYSLPFFTVNQIITEKQYMNIFYRIIVPGFEFQKLFNKLKFNKEQWLYPDLIYNDQNSFINLIANKMGRNSDEVNKMIRILNQIDDRFIINGVLSLVFDNKGKKANKFEIYKLDKVGLWNETKIEYIVYYEADISGNQTSLKLSELLIRFLCNSNEKMEEIFEHKNFRYMVEMMSMEIGR